MLEEKFLSVPGRSFLEGDGNKEGKGAFENQLKSAFPPSVHSTLLEVRNGGDQGPQDRLSSGQC